MILIVRQQPTIHPQQIRRLLLCQPQLRNPSTDRVPQGRHLIRKRFRSRHR